MLQWSLSIKKLTTLIHKRTWLDQRRFSLILHFRSMIYALGLDGKTT